MCLRKAACQKHFKIVNVLNNNIFDIYQTGLTLTKRISTDNKEMSQKKGEEMKVEEVKYKKA